MKRFLRAGVFALGLTGMLGTGLQPASATEVGLVAFVGHMAVHPGIGSPFTPFGDLSKIPDPTNPSFGNNSASFSFTSTTCIGITVTVNKNKPPVTGPACAMTMHGFVHGFCGMWHGTAAGTLSIGNQHFSFSFSFVDFGIGINVVNGDIHKHGASTSGLLFGLANAFPNPPPDPTSCLNKGPHSIQVIGMLTSVIITL